MSERTMKEGRWMFYPSSAFPPVPEYSGMKKVFPSTQVKSSAPKPAAAKKATPAPPRSGTGKAAPPPPRRKAAGGAPPPPRH